LTSEAFELDPLALGRAWWAMVHPVAVSVYTRGSRTVDNLLLRVFELNGAGFGFDGLDSHRKKFMMFFAADYDPTADFPTLPPSRCVWPR
jgi:hypothetical protein